MLRRSRRKSPTTITPEIIEAVRLASGIETGTDTAVRLGLSKSTVTNIQRKHKIPHFTRTVGRAFAMAARG